MPLFPPSDGFQVPTVTKNTLLDSEYILVVDGNGALGKITKADFLSELSPIAVAPTIPTYIYLPLNETTGIGAADISGNNRNAAYINTTLSASGTIFDGTGRVSLDNSINALTALSIGLEFKTASVLNQGLWEFRATQDLSSGTYTPAMMMNPSGMVAIYGYPSGSQYASKQNEDNTFVAYNDNAWHKSIVIMSTNVIKIFVDKVEIINISTNPITPFAGYFSIGSTRANSNFNGQLKNFKVWDSLLTNAQAIDFS